MKRKITFLLIVAPLFFGSCAMTKLTKQEAFPKFYEEKPVSILVAPPINNETAADAGEYYQATIAPPTSLHGFYIFPLPVVMEILKDEGVYNTLQELPQETVATRMYELFGADATLFTTILKWDKKYRGTVANLTVLIDYRIVSGKTGEILWSHAEERVIDTSVNSGVGGVAGLLIDAAATGIKTAATDYIPYARQANDFAFITLPYGGYHSLAGTDKDVQVKVFKSKMEETGGGPIENNE